MKSLFYIFALVLVANAAKDYDFQGQRYALDLIGSSGKLRLVNKANGKSLRLTLGKLEEVDATTLSPVNNKISSWAAGNPGLTWTNQGCGGLTCDPVNNEVIELRACFNQTFKVGNQGNNAPTTHIYGEIKFVNKSHFEPAINKRDGNGNTVFTENENGELIPAFDRWCNEKKCAAYGECPMRKLQCNTDNVNDPNAGCTSSCLAGFTFDERDGEQRCVQCLINGTTTVVPFSAGCPATRCRKPDATDGGAPPCTGDDREVPVTVVKGLNEAEWGCVFVPDRSMKFGIQITDWPWAQQNTVLAMGIDLSSTGKRKGKNKSSARADARRLEFDDGFYLENNYNVEVCNNVNDPLDCDRKAVNVSVDSLVVDYIFPRFSKRVCYDPVVSDYSTTTSPAPTSAPTLLLIVASVLFAYMAW